MTRSSGRLRKWAAGLASVSLISGCYTYVPLERSALGPGSVVRLRLTDAGAAAVAPYVGPRVEAVDGMITELVADSVVVLKLQQSVARGGVATDWAGESLRVPWTAVASTEQRKDSPRRTAMVAGGAIGVLAAIAAGFNLFGSHNGGHGTTGTTPK